MSAQKCVPIHLIEVEILCRVCERFVALQLIGDHQSNKVSKIHPLGTMDVYTNFYYYLFYIYVYKNRHAKD